MTITKIQNQPSFTQRRQMELPSNNNIAMEHLLLPSLHYRNCDDIPDTVNMIRPEAGQGRLLSNNPIASIGRFFANRYYDMKSVYKGYNGTANDHQLGRTNDVGLLLGGVAIASFLTTKRVTALPKRMEFVGLASFLTSMALWPKIGVFGPARLVHGFDVDKRYIDDQGRNKSVFQDPNYVPFDLYRGKNKSEDLSAIADYMGIDKNAKNRDEITKDQMRKVAVQNHTLWMWSSGFAVPTMTALLCNRFEHYYQPFLEKLQAKDARISMDTLYSIIAGEGSAIVTENAKDQKLANKTLESLSKNIGGYNTVAEEINKFTQFKEGANAKIVSYDEIAKFVNSLAKDAGEGVASGLAQDVTELLKVKDSVIINDNDFAQKLAKNIEAKYSGHAIMKKGIVSYDVIQDIITRLSKDSLTVDKNQLLKELASLGKAQIGLGATNPKDAKIAELFANDILRNGEKLLPKTEGYVLTAEKANILTELATPLNSYLAKFKAIKDVNLKQMGDVADSQNSYYWGKLEKKFTELVSKDVPFNKLKGLMDNKDAVKSLMQSNLENIAADKELYQSFIKEISDIKMAYLENMLGAGKEANYIGLILGENNGGGVNWNNRTFGANQTHVDKFIEMQSKISSDLKNSLDSGALQGKFGNLRTKVYGHGFRTSVAAHEVTANVGKIENFVTACDKIIHSLDVYRRAHLYSTTRQKEYVGGFRNVNVNLDWVDDLFKQAKMDTIAANSGDLYAKFNTRDKVRRFQSYMNLIFAPAENNGVVTSIRGRGYLTQDTVEAIGEESANTVRHWVNKFRNLVGHDDANWFYAQFKAGDCSTFDSMLTTADARYRVQGKNLVELVDQGIKKTHNSGKWLRTFTGLFVGVLSASLLAQFMFGKKDSTIPRARRGHRHHLPPQPQMDNFHKQDVKLVEKEAQRAN